MACRFLVGLGALLAGTLATAATAWMDDADLSATFSGATIDGHYESGLTFTESYASDGGLDYRESGRTLGGRWSVVNGTFCTLYDTSTTGGCFRVQRVSRNCYEFYFQARDEAAARAPEQGRPGWTARAWLVTQPATCRQMPTV